VAELEKHTGGADKGGTVKNFLQTLAGNNRLGILEKVCENFEKLMSAHRGEIELIISSAAVRWELYASKAGGLGRGFRGLTTGV